MLLEMNHITRYFDAFCALSDVSLCVDSGEVLGLLGENGAGKSTLMNILGGVLQPSAGQITFDGEVLTNLTPKIAGKKGIRFIHQELNVFNDLRVYENLFVGEELVAKHLLNKKEMIRQCQELLDTLEINQFSPTDLTEDLDTSGKQMLEIAHAIHNNCKLIIMDEPTSSLSNKDIDKLLSLIRKLKQQGIGIIYISHKMPEIFSICDKYLILRNGRVAEESDGCGFIQDISEQRVAELMIGRKLETARKFKPACTGETIMRVEDLSYKNNLHHISFELKKGEVLGFTGLSGDGRGELSELLFGSRRLESGRIILGDHEISNPTIQKMMRNGIGMVQRDRKERSVIPDMNILDNLLLSHRLLYQKKPLINHAEEGKHYEEVKKSTSLKAGAYSDSILSLSGGNQQKVIFGRWIEAHRNILILDNPTQGIDVGTKFDFYVMINALAEQGLSILLFSTEIRELQAVANRCFVMYKGEISKELANEEIEEDTVMYYATGSDKVTSTGKV